MLKYKFRLLIIFLVSFYSYNSRASYTIYPIDVKINNKVKVTSLNIQNHSPEEKNFQLTLYKVEKNNNKEILIKTKDLLVLPAMLKIKPNKSQLVRIAIVDNIMYSFENRGYKLVVQELPPPGGKMRSIGLNFITTMKLPVTIENNRELNI